MQNQNGNFFNYGGEENQDKFSNGIDNSINNQQLQTQQKQEKAVPVKNVKDEIANCMETKSISDSILRSFDTLVQQGQLTFPVGYNIGNELKLAYYDIASKGYLQTCDKQSVANAICEQVIQGLSIQKKQGYYIKYGNSLSFQRSYFGDIALVKRTNLVKDVYAEVIYEGDEIVIGFDEYGKKTIVKHTTDFGNIDNGIKGAYAVAVGQNGYKSYCIMTMKQIKQNWALSKDSTHKFQNNFPEEASKRTCIRRLIKMIFNTAIDLNENQNQIIGIYNQTSDEDYNNEEIKYSNVSTINAQVRESETEEISDFE